MGSRYEMEMYLGCQGVQHAGCLLSVACQALQQRGAPHHGVLHTCCHSRKSMEIAIKGRHLDVSYYIRCNF